MPSSCPFSVEILHFHRDLAAMVMLIGRFLVLKEQNSPTFWLKALLIMSSRDAESGTTARNSYIAMAAAFHGGRLGWNNATCVGF